MGIFDIIGTALSVATTIGKVAGALSGALSGDLVHLGRAQVGNSNPDLGEVVFWRDKQTGMLMVGNQSTDTSVALFFPGNPYGGAGAESIILGSMQKFPVGDIFTQYANADVDDLVITPFLDDSSAQAEAGVGTGGPTGISIQASGQNIAPRAKVQLGPSVVIEASDTTVQVAVVGGLVLAGIVLLNVRGAGTTAARILNVLRKPSDALDDDTSMTVAIPQGIDIANGISSIDVILAVQSASPTAAIPALAPHPDAVPFTDEDLARLAASTPGQ
ncbi:hypothetical protein ABT023_21885 [Micromonospora sp. NPDC002296]|uniref:hypothetical protein n=1 Tax=Micromonospora sp. NPDC002296 TaxID=3154271 RepID=UPI003317AE6B